MINNQDMHKIRTACYIYLKTKAEGATAKQLLNYINYLRIPLKVTGISTQAISKILRDSSGSWGFYNEKNKRGNFVWRVR